MSNYELTRKIFGCCENLNTIPETPNEWKENAYAHHRAYLERFKQEIVGCTSQSEEKFKTALARLEDGFFHPYDSGPQPSKGTHG